MQLTDAQRRTLQAIQDRGGRVNGYAGQPGMNAHSMDALTRRGLLRRLERCDACQQDEDCTRLLGGARCYGPREITDEGRQALAQ